MIAITKEPIHYDEDTPHMHFYFLPVVNQVRRKVFETDKDGNQQVRDFYGKILGKYDKSLNVTRDFYGRILTRGNTVAGLVYKK